MAFLQYGPVTIGLSGLLATERYERHPLVSGPNYTGRRHVITVRGYVNPASLSAISTVDGNGANNPLAPAVGPGNPPPQTEVAIRFMLEQPRQPLIYSSGNTIVLFSPNPGTPVDAANGPFAKVTRMTPVLGEFKTWLIDFTVETVMNDCPPLPPGTVASFGAIANRAIVANVWQMEQVTDADGLTIRETTGSTTFRTDILASGGLPGISPDQLRPFFMPPPFPNSRREVTLFRQSESNDAATWKIRDVELMANVVGQGVTRVALIHEAEVVTINYAEFIAEKLAKAAEIAGRAAIEYSKELAAASANPLPPAAVPGMGAATLALGAGYLSLGVAAGIRAAREIIPTVAISVLCTVWGRRDASRQTLMNYALQLVNARLTFSLGGGVLGTTARVLAGKTIRVSHDCAGRSVSVVAIMRTNMPNLAFTWIGGVPIPLLTLPDIGSFFPQFDDTTFTGAPGGTLNGLLTGNLPGQSLPNQNGTRGTFIGLAQAPAVVGPCGFAPQPGQTPNANTTPVVGPSPPQPPSGPYPVPGGA